MSPRRYTPARSLRGRKVYYHYSGSEVLSVTFVRWCRTRMHTGGEDSDRLGVGAIVKSPLIAEIERINHARPDHGLKRGFHRLRPYWRIFRTYRDAYANRRPITPPPVSRVRKATVS